MYTGLTFRITLTLFICCWLGTWCVQAQKSNEYCKGDFEATKATCSKFAFSQTESDSDRCGSKKKSDDSKSSNIIKLANCTTFYDITDLPDQSMDNHTMKMAQLITNVFENGNTDMGYAAVQKLGDCRGFTCGYIGFTTGTNDAYAVVARYVERRSNSPLKKYLNELKRLSQLDFGDPLRDETNKLDGFDAAWKKAACEDAEFVQTQLDVGHAMYMKPALKYAASVGVHSNLGKALFYDTIVQHGWQYVEPEINLPRILQITGPKKKGESEKEYLTRFITTRRQLVCCFPGNVWNESSDRMFDLQKVVDDWEKNRDLKEAVHLQVFDVTVKGTESIDWDKQHCKSQPDNSAQPEDLPIPDKCPNPLVSQK